MISTLHVLIWEGPLSWEASGIEINYEAVGSGLDDARRNFETGLAITIANRLRGKGTIENLFRNASYRAASDANIRRYPQISDKVFPFGIEYIEKEILDVDPRKPKHDIVRYGTSGLMQRLVKRWESVLRRLAE